MADLALDDLAQRGVFGRKFLERLHERAVAALELLDAARDHVDQDVRVVDRLQGVFDVVVSHGRGDSVVKTGNSTVPGAERQG